MESLNKWATILNDHIKKLNIPEEKRKEYLNRQIRSFQMYQDPDESLLNKANGSNTSQATSNASVPTSASGATLTKMISIEKEEDLLPLDPYILNKNIGLPVIVIVTKVKFYILGNHSFCNNLFHLGFFFKE